MAKQFQSCQFNVSAPNEISLECALREQLDGASWTQVRRLIATGKVGVNGSQELDPRRVVAQGAVVVLSMTARKTSVSSEPGPQGVVYADPHIVVVNKRAGISSVDHDSEVTSSQSELRRMLERREGRRLPPLRVVHRLDKVTSGVMLFARSAAAQVELKRQFKAHTTGRVYTAVAHGLVRSGTLSFRLVKDRGDGYRGVTRDSRRGTPSVTHVQVLDSNERCSLLQCRLETGRTHQIRIHLAHIGHPLVGDPLYLRDFRGQELRWERTLLHAGYLSFTHPVFRKKMDFQEELPEPFTRFLGREGLVTTSNSSEGGGCGEKERRQAGS